MTYRSSKSVRPMRVTKRPKKKERHQKERKTKPETQEWQTGHSPRPPTSSDRNEILRGGWSSDVSSKVRISPKSVKRFRSCGGRNLPTPIDLATYTTACTTVQAVTMGARSHMIPKILTLHVWWGPRRNHW